MTDTASIDLWLERHASFTPDKSALVADGTAHSYSGLAHWVAALAMRLREEHGVGHGDRVAYLGLNRAETIAVVFACARLGAMLVPLNWRLATAELDFIVTDSAPRLVVADDEFLEVAQRVAGTVSVAGLGVVGPTGGDDLGGPAGAAHRGGTLDDPLLIVYTSGTTGRPKGTVLDQRAVLFNALNSLHMHGLTARDTVLVVLPLFHVGGLNIQLLPALYAGATVHLHPRFDPGDTIAAVERVRPDLLVLVPATMEAIRRDARWPDADFSSLRMLTTGSSVVPVDLIAAYEARGISVVQVYGSTETSPIAAYQRPGEGRTLPRATGRVALHCDLRLVRPDGSVIAAVGQDGEIEVRGPNVMRAYWNRPVETAAALKDGWFATGDVGCFDEAGNLYFRDRLKRMIVSGGENVYSAEVERVLDQVAGIAESCVVAMADPQWGEVPVAAIVPDAGATFDEAAARHALDGELARFKHPKRFHVFDALPRNAMGKVVADAVRAAVAERENEPSACAR